MSQAAEDWRSQPAPGWQRPAIGEHPIEGYRYTSREFFAREFEQMWTKVWLLLGREEEMPNPGNWQREDVGPESILMVRQKDGSVKAFYNVCQHRGNRLVFAEKGHVRRSRPGSAGWARCLGGCLAPPLPAQRRPGAPGRLFSLLASKGRIDGNT